MARPRAPEPARPESFTEDDLAALVAELNRPEPPPPVPAGWYTIEDVQTRCKCSKSTAKNKLARALKLGRVEAMQIPNGRGQTRTVWRKKEGV